MTTAMASEQVELESFTVSSLDAQVSLTLSTSVALSLAAGSSDLHTGTELAAMVNSGDLWISRAGTCRLSMRAQLNGKPVKLPECLVGAGESLVDLIQGAQIWPELGIELRRDNTQHQGFGAESGVQFSIRNIETVQETPCPPSILSTQLQEVSCLLSFQSKQEPSALSDPPKRKRALPPRLCSKKRKISAELPSSYASTSTQTDDQLLLTHPAFFSNLEDLDEDGLFSGLMDNDDLALFDLHPTSLPHPRSADTMGGLVYEDSFAGLSLGWKMPDDVSRPETLIHIHVGAKDLVGAALSLLFGPKRKINGIQMSPRVLQTSLLSLAPAAWSVPFLKLFASHADHLTTISNCLTDLQDAQSPILRQKLRELLAEPPRVDQEADMQSGNSLEYGQTIIEKRLRNLLRSRLVTTKARESLIRKEAVAVTESQTSSQSNNVGDTGADSQIGRFVLVQQDDLVAIETGQVSSPAFGNTLQIHELPGVSYNQETGGSHQIRHSLPYPRFVTDFPYFDASESVRLSQEQENAPNVSSQEHQYLAMFETHLDENTAQIPGAETYFGDDMMELCECGDTGATLEVLGESLAPHDTLGLISNVTTDQEGFGTFVEQLSNNETLEWPRDNLPGLSSSLYCEWNSQASSQQDWPVEWEWATRENVSPMC